MELVLMYMYMYMSITSCDLEKPNVTIIAFISLEGIVKRDICTRVEHKGCGHLL